MSHDTINNTGAITGTNSRDDPCMKTGMTRCWPRKKEPDAMVSAADSRHR